MGTSVRHILCTKDLLTKTTKPQRNSIQYGLVVNKSAFDRLAFARGKVPIFGLLYNVLMKEFLYICLAFRLSLSVCIANIIHIFQSTKFFVYFFYFSNNFTNSSVISGHSITSFSSASSMFIPVTLNSMASILSKK